MCESKVEQTVIETLLKLFSGIVLSCNSALTI